MKKINFLTLAKKAKKIAEDKKGENVVLLDVKNLTEITNYFVIATANSTPQINAIANEIEKTLKYDYNVPAIRKDGNKSVNWKVLDFGGLIVHIMSFDLRLQYDIEKIWTTLEDTNKVTKNSKKIKAAKTKKTATKKTSDSKTKPKGK
jgi:ribosome-associated protein